MISSDSGRTCALAAGAVFFASVLYTRYVLRIHFLEVPALWLLAFGVFHLGLVLPWALGLYDDSKDWWIQNEDIPSALLLIIMAVVSYQIGMIASKGDPLLKQEKGREQRKPLWVSDRTLFTAGLTLMIASGAAYIYGFAGVFGQDLADTAYSDIYQMVSGADSRLYGVGLVLFPAGIYAAAAGSTRRQLLALFGCAALWSGWQLFLGFRSRALLVLFAVLYIAAKKGFQLPRRALAISLFAFLCMSPVISVMREETVGRRFSSDLWAEANPFRGVAEMGQAIWPVAETHRLIGPQELRLGKTYLVAIQRIVPNIAIQYVPGKRLRETSLYDSPAYWFVLVTSPSLFRLNLGRGFSVVAEAYMNFGGWGVVIIFLGLGYGLVRLEHFAGRNAFTLAAAAIVLDPLLWVVRNDFTVFTRTAAWGCMFILSVWLFALWTGAQKKSTPVVYRNGPMGLGPASDPRLGIEGFERQR